MMKQLWSERRNAMLVIAFGLAWLVAFALLMIILVAPAIGLTVLREPTPTAVPTRLTFSVPAWYQVRTVESGARVIVFLYVPDTTTFDDDVTTVVDIDMQAVERGRVPLILMCGFYNGMNEPVCWTPAAAVDRLEIR